MVLTAGIEPARPKGQQILSPFYANTLQKAATKHNRNYSILHGMAICVLSLTIAINYH